MTNDMKNVIFWEFFLITVSDIILLAKKIFL